MSNAALKGYCYLVTGASSGIGRAVCVAISKAGGSVVLAARSEERMLETLALMEPGGHSVECVDMKDFESIMPLLARATQNGGELGGLVHCAGIQNVLPLRALKPEVFMEHMSVHTVAFVELVRAYAQNTKNAAGSIVYISSVRAAMGSKGLTAYCAAKAAGEACVRCLAAELASRSVRVNAVAPAYIQTPMLEQARSIIGADGVNKILEQQYLGIGRPEDVADAVVFLLSGASRFITGTTISVDGGYLSSK